MIARCRRWWSEARAVEVGFPYGYSDVPLPQLIGNAAELREGHSCCS
ncbi:hypothetical protein OG453_38195 [Streptomyces sp. NBC_01381]|nr:hypothetical protein [Streptomyces sp. NBC_01381]MCX4672422.1 hypothetical protein [Streptomyces sp. NBC_01381]